MQIILSPEWEPSPQQKHLQSDTMPLRHDGIYSLLESRPRPRRFFSLGIAFTQTARTDGKFLTASGTVGLIGETDPTH